ncbi:MAG: PAS domain-containing protein [Deltaproteobacteria bacterium]|nr:PAS domain-containing protein [Deltaproteobacteria bacterium]
MVRAPGRQAAAAGAFPIVGVGASAGGLDAFRQLLSHVPADAGMALVLVQHLEATRASLLSDALALATAMKVAQAEDGVRVEPNRVYVIPPGTQMAIERGVLRLSALQEDERRPHLPIDFFLQSLAEDRGRQSIGVVLSGNASDGTAGLAAIRAQGGITFAQEPGSARFSAMPQSAVNAGVVDFCLPLPGIGAELCRLARHPYVANGEAAAPALAGAAVLSQVLAVLRSTTGVDFGEHKPATFRRRLARRMTVRNAPDLAAYLALLRRDPAEVQALFDDLLIKVTSFFRDEEAFEALRAIAFPEIVRHKGPGAPVRAWVVGCATGEEVYSLAIAYLEQAGEGGPTHPLLVFGSDLSDQAIEVARAGVYPDAAVRGMGEERRKRFFVRTDRGWRVQQSLREMCVFVRHDVARDPPFARLDLVSCRNVLIYFGQALQRRVLATAHYALLQPGFLLLGSSESAAGGRWFTPARTGSRLFRRRPGASRLHLALRAGALPAGEPAASPQPTFPAAEGDRTRLADALVLARYGPPGVVVDENLQVLEFRGRTGRYLEPPAGEPQGQLLRMAPPGLQAPLRIALAQARKSAAPVRKEGVQLEGTGRSFDLVVLPVKAGGSAGEPAFVVLFEERALPARLARPRKAAAGRAGAVHRALEEELAAARDQVAALLDEHGRGTDALATANEELVSSNEELQSLNEELETAKEELQATNEELTTVNDELHGRNLELQLVNADVLNLLDAIEMPILILDAERRIRRFTRHAATFLGLGPADAGRHIGRVPLPIRAPDLERWIARAMEDGILVEGEVQDHSDRWHRLQIRPHRGASGLTDGAVLSLVDIDRLHQEVRSAREGERHGVDMLALAEAARRRAQEADAAKDLFLAGLSHELRTPLSVILLQSQLLQRAPLEAAAVARSAATIEANARRQARLVDELLDLSRITTGKLTLSAAEVDWKVLVEEVVAAARPEAEAKGVRLEVDESGPVSCWGDAVRLQQVVGNLVANAVKFTPGGGRVNVRVGAVDGVARVTVADTGRGIDPSFLPHVFEKFAQEHPGARQDPGIGLGLSIVHDLVALHGGRVQAESPGRDLGATFTVEIPRSGLTAAP